MQIALLYAFDTLEAVRTWKNGCPNHYIILYSLLLSLNTKILPSS